MAITKTKCPYCGFEMDYERTENKQSEEMIYCDKEEGGCGSPYVVKSKIILVISDIKKIEGYEREKEWIKNEK